MRLRLFKRKEVWVITLWGWFVIILVVFILLFLPIKYIHPFLALNAPVHGEILVIKGWVTDDVLQKAIDTFRKGNYRFLITTGGPLQRGSPLIKHKTFAELSAKTLVVFGFDRNLLRVVPVPYVRSNRTFACAIALKKWISDSNSNITTLDIMSLGAHTRRSRLLYEYALGGRFTVGAIAGENIHYNSDEWWKTSEGVRTVIGESIAYIYARFFFSSSDRQSEK